MSNHLISATYSRSLGSHTRKAVMVLFSDKASDEGEGVFASKVTMADELDLSRRALISTIQGLEADGIITTIGTRPNGVVEYAINVAVLMRLPLTESASRRIARCEARSHLTENEGVKEGNRGVKEGNRGCEARSHNPSLNPPEPINPSNEGVGNQNFQLELESVPKAVEAKPEHVVEIWNEVAARIGKPKVRDLTDSRRQAVRQRIAQYSITDFQQVFRAIETSPFLRGDRGWSGCTFDWAMKRTNFQKIIEGNYNG